MLRSTTIAATLLFAGSAVAADLDGERSDARNNATITTPDTPFDFAGPGVGQGTCPGDVNEDGKVDVDDLIMIIMSYGSTGSTDLPGDTNDDGVVDVKDILVVIEDWGPCP